MRPFPHRTRSLSRIARIRLSRRRDFHVGSTSARLSSRKHSHWRRNRDDGIALLHTIGGNRSPRAVNPWFGKYIFPNALVPSLAQVAREPGRRSRRAMESASAGCGVSTCSRLWGQRARATSSHTRLSSPRSAGHSLTACARRWRGQRSGGKRFPLSEQVEALPRSVLAGRGSIFAR